MRLIDADKLPYEDIKCVDGRIYMVVNACDIDNAPTISVHPKVKTGHWVNKSWTMGCGVQVINVTCSCCGEASGLQHMEAPYCPNCGAKMESKGEE